MIPQAAGIVAIVGRPNVGKSTLFNRLCKSRDALVHDRSGLTRDRKYGTAKSIPNAEVTLIDTGGLHDAGAISTHVDAQVRLAIDESDLVLFMVSARDGLTSYDREISDELRRSSARVLLVVNKIDGMPHGPEFAFSEFSELGMGDCLPVSASNGHGFDELVEAVLADLPAKQSVESTDEPRIPVAVIGRPNVGKSTLVNALSSDERCIVFDEPGTTRDAIHVVVESGEDSFELIDTAGIRRKGSVRDVIEKFSVVKALEALRAADVTLLVIDACEGIVEQDLHLIQFAVEAGSGVVLVVNKWDMLDAEARSECRDELNRRLRFAEWVLVRFVSALKQQGTEVLLKDVARIHESGKFELSANEVTNILTDLVTAHAPPVVLGRTIRLRYAHKIDSHPPSILVHGNQTASLPSSYKRYLENGFRNALDLDGWPVVIELRTSKNPFGDRRNLLTERQKRHRDRLRKHRRSK